MHNLAFEDTESINDSLKKSKYSANNSVVSYDEAIKLVGLGKFHIYLLIVCGMCFLAVMVEVMGVSMIMNAAKCDLKFSLYEQGYLASSGFLGIVLSSHIMGFLADTCGRVKTLKYGLGFSLISSIISIFSNTVWMLIVFRFFVGVFLSASQACVFSFFGEFHDNKSRAKRLTLVATFLPIALILLPVISYIILPLNIEFFFIVKFTPWRLVLLFNIVPSLCTFIALQFFPESPKYLLIQGQQDDALKALQKIYSINNNKNEKDYPVMSIETDVIGEDFRNVKTVWAAIKLIWTQTIPLFYTNRVLHTLNICFSNFMLFAVCQGIIMWFPTLLVPMFAHIDETETICENLENNTITLATTDINDVDILCEVQPDNHYIYYALIAAGVTYTIIFIIFSFTIDFFGKKNLLIVWLALTGACGILLNWSNNFYLNVVLLIIFIGGGSAGGIISAIAVDFFPANVNSMGMSLSLMSARLGAFVGSNVIGVILKYNCSLLFLIFGSITMALVPFSYLLPSKK